ncbi:hypothetical protein J8I29_21245 [Labrys sp. LIt4]|uniref:beta strand repeat-containing protein n=1 Tax=Labrys sp. LIt4 TaxID=2821355 RepID=UPI001AE0165E|nr:hypothetical protein [Labrys sp. LIt4]MBP0581869.1 hypothetical protein [Labrys sp. LIt4]
MTIPSYDNRRTYAGDGSTTVFAFPPPFTANTDLVVQIQAADGATVTKTLGMDYMVTGAGSPAGGSVTMTAAPTTGTTLIIYRDVPLTQSVDLQDGGPLPAPTINRALDRITMWGQRLKEQVVALGALANQTAAGLMSPADKAKLDGIQAGAQVNTVTSVAGRTGAVTLVKGDVSLGNVDNTSDLNKPISTATQAALNTKANTSALAAVAFSGAKADVGLGNVDNTADTNKPVSSAQAAADTATLNSAKAYTDSKANKASVGLGNVDNTSDLNKPISTATQAALDLKANTSSLGSAAFQPSTAFATAAQGAKADTAVQGLQAGLNIEIDNTDPLHPKVTAVGSAVGGDVTGPAGGVAANEVVLFDGATGKLIKGSGIQIANVAKINTVQTWTTKPTFSVGAQTISSDPAANPIGSNDVASTKYVFDLFNYFYSTGSIVGKDSPAFTGNPTAPTPQVGDNDTSIATTSFVQGEINARPKLKIYSANATLSPSDTHSIIRIEGGTVYNLPDNSASPKSIEYAIFNATNATVTITVPAGNYLYTRDGISASGGSYTLTPYGAILVNAANWDWYILENKRIPGIPTAYSIGDLLYADSATTLAALADVAGGNVLRSGGVGAAPSWGKVGLTTHVSGALPVTNGGTGLTSAGSNGQVLTIVSGAPAWSSNAATWPLGSLYGLILSQGSTTSVGISVGGCTNEDGGSTYNMVLGSAITKSLSAWAAGSGNGALDTGSIAPSTWYHVHLIRKDSDGSIDALLSLSTTAPTMPSGYTARRRLGSIRTNGSSQVTAFLQVGDEFIWTVPVMDRNGNSASGATSVTISVPSGVRVKARLRGAIQTTASNFVTMSVYSPEITDQTAMSGNAGSASMVIPISGAPFSSNSWGASAFDVVTNTSSQVRVAVTSTSTAGTVALQTDGWIDARGRF